MKHALRGFGFATACLLLTSASAFAQLSTAQLSGRVTDESGAVLPGATVTATQTDTGFTRNDLTDANGSYLLSNLPPGPYRLEVSLQGFRTYVQTGIVLQVAASPMINAVLTVGAASRRRSRSRAPRRSSTCRVSGHQRRRAERGILALPLNGRNRGRARDDRGRRRSDDQCSQRALPGGLGISVAGGQSFGVAYLLDGAMHNNPQDNLNLPLPFPDALQEFSVATSGLSAQNGMHSGAAVNAVTKSGTNRFSGNVFEFLRDHRFNATNPFAPIGPGRQARGRRPAAQPVRRHARAGRSCGTSSSSSAATRARPSVSSRPRTSPGCRRPRCSPATSRRSRRPPATAAGRSRCAADSRTTGSIRRSSAARR